MPNLPILFNGKLNFDDALTLIAKGDFIDALNVTRDQVGSMGDLVISSIVGNKICRTIALPVGTNKVIGAKADNTRNRIYSFIWNSEGRNRIEYYDLVSLTTVVLLEDDPNNIVLAFNPNDKIMDSDIIYNDQDGDLLYWNQRTLMPRKLNVSRAISGFYTPLNTIYFEAAKRPPLFPPEAQYNTDTNIKINNLKGKLFEFAYRFIYNDFEKSTFSPLSASPELTLDYISGLNPASNNSLLITVDTGSKMVSKIEIVFRYNIGNIYSDYSSMVVLDKAGLGIANNSTYQFTFANDGAYPTIPTVESLSYYDFFPRKANAQATANGNYLVYGGITEGYNGLSKSQLNVIANVTYEEVELPGGVIVIGNPQMTIEESGNSFEKITTITIGSTVTPGDQFGNIYYVAPGFPVFTINYTALLGDDRNTVANYFVTQFNAQGYPNITAIFLGSGVYRVTTIGISASSSYISGSVIAAQSSAGGGAFFDRIYKAGGKFRFGMIYFDEQGRVIGNPVNTYVSAPGNINDFEVEIAEFYATATNYIRPIINITVQHLPPPEAKSFAFLRTNNLLVQTFYDFKTDDFHEDGGFWYISNQDVIDFGNDNPNFASQWTYEEGDRIKIMYKYNGANASGYGSTYTPIIDAPIIGVVKKTYSPNPEQSYIKIQQYTGTVTPTPDDNLVFEVYRPSLKTAESQQQYFEFGETYECVVIDGVNYHEGQTATTNPTFQFSDGDVYIRIRSGTGDDYLILDPNYSDYYASAVNSNGRIFIENDNAKQTYNPVLVRFSQAYQFGTNINGLNTFYEENFDEYNRAYGDIMKMDQIGSYLKIGQKFRIGTVPVLLQMVRDFNQENVLATSDQLLNKINYHDGDFGVGDAPEAWTGANFVRYFCDTNRGVVCRLSMDGVTPISILYKINSWATRKLPLRTGNSKIYGVFNARTNKYEISLEASTPNGVMTVGAQEKFSYSGQYLVSFTLANACTGSELTVYSGVPFATGVILYIDEALTIALTGSSYITSQEGIIYEIDPATGEVGEPTDFVCNTGIFGNYLVDTVLANICDNLPQGLYTENAFGVGEIVYIDSSISTALTGYNYIASGGVIYNIDPVTGEVGAATGNVCNSGTPGQYRLGNDTNIICMEGETTLYTNGAFAIGSILYLDAALVTPVTTYDYVVNVTNANIYNLNDTTGEVGSLTGGTCATGELTVTNSTVVEDNVLISDVSMGGSTVALTGGYPVAPSEIKSGVHYTYTGTISVLITAEPSLSDTWSLRLYKNAVLQECIELNPNPAGTHTFASASYLNADSIGIQLNNGGCV